MTFAEKYRAAGHAAGRQEGALEARRRPVLRALEIRHRAVSAELAARVDALESEELLDELLEVAICSASRSDFERQLPTVP